MSHLLSRIRVQGVVYFFWPRLTLISRFRYSPVRRRTNNCRYLGTKPTRRSLQRAAHDQTCRSQRRHRDPDHAHPQSHGDGVGLANLIISVCLFCFPPLLFAGISPQAISTTPSTRFNPRTSQPLAIKFHVMPAIVYTPTRSDGTSTPPTHNLNRHYETLPNQSSFSFCCRCCGQVRFLLRASSSMLPCFTLVTNPT